MVNLSKNVIIIDDSAVVRRSLSQALNNRPGIHVISTAVHPIIAQHKICRDKPDVIILDIDMPKMDGLTFLRNLRKESSIPVIIFSAYSPKGSEKAIEALDLGAFAVICKPTNNNLQETIKELALLIKGAPKLKRSVQKETKKITKVILKKVVLKKVASSNGSKIRDNKIIAIGASTGGTDAIRDVLIGMPENSPPILVVIHMPIGFTGRFAERLDNICRITVCEARDNMPLHQGLALIAPGDQHLILKKTGNGYSSGLWDGSLVMRHKPSVEVLFRSVAKAGKRNSLGIILTGMGADGADGISEMHQSGAFTIAQNEETCIVFGMPKEAIKRGEIDTVLPLGKIHQRCIEWMK